MRVVTADQARSSVLGAQGLAERFDDPLRAVEACIAVQTQYAASLSVAVAARTKRDCAGWDRKALAAGGELVKSWSLRHTLHAHSRADHALILAVVGPKFYERFRSWKHRPASLDMELVHEEILAALLGGPLTRAQLHDRVPDLRKVDYAGWGMDVMGLAFQGKLCVIGSGAEQKFCLVEAEAVREAAMEELLRRYLRSYGPATQKDFAYWTGLLMREIRPAFEAIADELEAIEVEGLPGVRYRLTEHLDGPSPFRKTPPLPRLAKRANPFDGAPQADGLASPVLTTQTKLPALRLLAKFDPVVMAHADKRLFMGEEHRSAVFRKAGQVEATILIRGQVAGTWRMGLKRRGLAIEAEPFRALGKADRGRLDREGQRLARALGLAGAEVKVR